MRNVSWITAVVICFQTLAGAQQASFASEQDVQPLQRDSVLWGDFDLDGLDDLYRLDPGAGDRLLRNVGDGTFEDVTQGALPPATGPSRQAMFVDVNGDGHLDLHLIGAGGESRVLRNTGFAAFEDVTLAASIVHDEPALDAEWRDYDGDGLPDLRLVLVACDRLFHNEGEGRFQEVAFPIVPGRELPTAIRAAGILADVGPDGAQPTSIETRVGRSAEGTSLQGRAQASSSSSPRSRPDPGGESTASWTGGPGWPGGTSRAIAGSPTVCADALRDQSAKACLRASSLPILGLLLPYPGLRNVMGNLAFAGGGERNQANGAHSGIVGGRENTAGDAYDSIGGGYRNATGKGDAGTIGGGLGNFAGGTYYGFNQAYEAYYVTVAGGANNQARRATGATIGGGVGNYAGGIFTVYQGAQFGGKYATVSGGANNTAKSAIGTTIGGGMGNYAGGTLFYYGASHATVGGGRLNRAEGPGSTIAGGRRNTASSYDSAVGGGTYNTASGQGSAVGGGRDNVATGNYATVAGGWDNRAYDQASIGGGRNNTASDRGTVGGGENNSATVRLATVGGGLSNSATQKSAAVAGGEHNAASAIASTVAGGQSNTASGRRSAIAGGRANASSGHYSTVAGGRLNTAGGKYGSVAGGRRNSAGGTYSSVAGGRGNTAGGNYSFAAGRRALANHDGAFVWGDSFAADRTSSVADEFNVYAGGGARIFSSSDGSTGVLLAAGAGSWSSVSDRSSKENLTPVDPRAVLARVLAMPISTWNYRAQADSVRHMGPMAQDFRAAFGLGVSEKLIDTIDPDGVALAAIQGLHETARLRDAELEARLLAQDEEIARLQADVARTGELESAVDALEQELTRVTRLLSVACASR